jgi:hypothetical protein
VFEILRYIHEFEQAETSGAHEDEAIGDLSAEICGYREGTRLMPKNQVRQPAQ